MIEPNTIYYWNGTAAEKYMEETERLVITIYQENRLAAGQSLVETPRSAPPTPQGCGI